MPFCPHFWRDINFEPDAIQPCCDVRALGTVPRFPHAGGDLDVAAYEVHILHVIKELQTGGDVCRGCPELTGKDAPGGTGPIGRLRLRTVSLNMHRHICNCRCVYCDLWRHPAKCHDILPALRSLASHRALRPDCFFSWGGGEPTLLREFPSIAEWIAYRGHSQYVHTNALKHSDAIASLLKSDKFGINISLDSASAQTYNAIKGVDGFGRVKKNITRYIAEAADPSQVTVKYIIFSMNNNLSEITKFVTLCKDIGIKSVQFSFDFRDLKKKLVSNDSMIAASELIYRTALDGIRCEPFFVDAELLQPIIKMTLNR
jgi:sulfatase maturation enzyme AslB (radical SAM superfamily)